MRMNLGMRDTLSYDCMHCMIAVSLEIFDEPHLFPIAYFVKKSSAKGIPLKLRL